MLFNSVEFLFFLPIVFALYWFVFNARLRWQNALILMASYLFYGWWDWRFLSLLMLSTCVDYVVSRQIFENKEQPIRKRWLYVSMAFNLGLLGFFKYFNFFVDSWIDAFAMVGYEMNVSTMRIILPVGISFYTFQTMSYAIDVYRKQLEPTKDFVSFAAFVAFFPQLVAGPIERATNLLPQILRKRKFSYEQAMEGVYLIIWGMFKKVVLADSIAPVVNDIFRNYQQYSGGTLIVGAVGFAFQIYGDFSGYSDMARGVSKLFGFELMVNFNFPYFSRNIPEFWRRWHISLSTWFRDYLYFPLGGSRLGTKKTIRNVFAIFLVSGIWHGANWTFIIWGFIHALLYLPSILFPPSKKSNADLFSENKFLPSPLEFAQVLGTFCIVTIAWVFFRAESVGKAVDYLRHFAYQPFTIEADVWKTKIGLYILLFVGLDYLHALKIRLPVVATSVFTFISIEVILYFLLKSSSQKFIYFDF